MILIEAVKWTRKPKHYSINAEAEPVAEAEPLVVEAGPVAATEAGEPFAPEEKPPEPEAPATPVAEEPEPVMPEDAVTESCTDGCLAIAFGTSP